MPLTGIPRMPAYLLKDRVFTDEQFIDAPHTVARSGTLMDPEVVMKLLAYLNP